MFVTAWEGNIDLKTGFVHFANAGHNPPIIMRKDGTCEYVKGKAGFVLAGMEGARYREYELELKAGDCLFVYTDGVAEATDLSNTLYGTDRMIAALNSAKNSSCRQLLESLHQDMNAFVGEADQFDDITMLCFEYKKKMNA